MTIHIDEKKLADAINAKVDVPYLPESLEAQGFQAGVAAAVQALVEGSKSLVSLADYGVTVTA